VAEQWKGFNLLLQPKFMNTAGDKIDYAAIANSPEYIEYAKTFNERDDDPKLLSLNSDGNMDISTICVFHDVALYSYGINDHESELKMN
jgi:hypothetical protein